MTGFCPLHVGKRILDLGWGWGGVSGQDHPHACCDVGPPSRGAWVGSQGKGDVTDCSLEEEGESEG